MPPRLPVSNADGDDYSLHPRLNLWKDPRPLTSNWLDAGMQPDGTPALEFGTERETYQFALLSSDLRYLATGRKMVLRGARALCAIDVSHELVEVELSLRGAVLLTVSLKIDDFRSALRSLTNPDSETMTYPDGSHEVKVSLSDLVWGPVSSNRIQIGLEGNFIVVKVRPEAVHSGPEELGWKRAQ